MARIRSTAARLAKAVISRRREIGHGAHLEAAVTPFGQREAVALPDRRAGIAGHRRAGHRRERELVLVAAIDQHGHLAAVDDVEPAADQREAFRA